jgi:cell division septation protein DedD
VANRQSLPKSALARRRASAPPRRRQLEVKKPRASTDQVFLPVLFLARFWFSSQPICPSGWKHRQGSKEQVATDAPAAPSVTFEFPDILKDREIQVDTSPYQTESSKPSDTPRSYKVQAASFRDRGEADELRANLLLSNLPATVVVSDGDTGRWFRVTLGPFDRRVDANRALTKLRERGISGIVLINND